MKHCNLAWLAQSVERVAFKEQIVPVKPQSHGFEPRIRLSFWGAFFSLCYSDGNRAS